MKYRLRFSLVLSAAFVLATFTLAFADKGVFSAKASPHEAFINTPTTITVSAEVGAQNLYISSVRLYETTKTGQPIRLLTSMYDDGTHGDAIAADTVFTGQFSLNNAAEAKMYVQVTAAYQGDRNRYLSGILEVSVFKPLSDGVVNDLKAVISDLTQQFNGFLASNSLQTARELTVQAAKNNPDISDVVLSGDSFSFLYKKELIGIVFVGDPSIQRNEGGLSSLPSNVKNPGSNKVLLYSPGYNGTHNGRMNVPADTAKTGFDSSAYFTTAPKPLDITADASASLDLVKSWGNYGAIQVNTHGGYVNNPITNKNEVVILTGTDGDSNYASTCSDNTELCKDYKAGRIGVFLNKIAFFPSYVTEHTNSMKDTFLYFDACESLHDDSLWNALRNKGAKVAFGWTKSVCRTFDNNTFSSLIGPMLPSDNTVTPLTAKQSFDAIATKVDDTANCTENAEFSMRVASSEWENFAFVDGGLVNGGFETGDFTGWTRGSSYSPNYSIISGTKKSEGQYSAALGRWDTAYHGADSTAEPYGYEWLYQDFVVPSNRSTLKFKWWMETYDTAAWDWLDAYIKDTNGSTLKVILSQAGKPGTNYGPYWTTPEWQEASVDISQYRGQKIRIYFDQRLDGWGDQQRTYIDNVRLE